MARSMPLPTLADAPIMDLDHLSVFTDGDANLKRELAARHRSSAQDDLAAMAKARRSGDS